MCIGTYKLDQAFSTSFAHTIVYNCDVITTTYCITLQIEHKLWNNYNLFLSSFNTTCNTTPSVLHLPILSLVPKLSLESSSFSSLAVRTANDEKLDEGLRTSLSTTKLQLAAAQTKSRGRLRVFIAKFLQFQPKFSRSF